MGRRRASSSSAPPAGSSFFSQLFIRPPLALPSINHTRRHSSSGIQQVFRSRARRRLIISLRAHHNLVLTACVLMSHTITLVSSDPVIRWLVFFGTIMHVIDPLWPAKRVRERGISGKGFNRIRIGVETPLKALNRAKSVFCSPSSMLNIVAGGWRRFPLCFSIINGHFVALLRFFSR
jgi:hypothetical protein